MENRNSSRNSFDSSKNTSPSKKVKKTVDGKVVWQFSAKKGGNENQLQKKKAILSPLLTKFSSSYIQESFVEGEEEDDTSIQFSVDPDMLQKLNLRRLHLGEEYAPNDSDKILKFQLERDIKKLIEVKGSFKERSKKFISLRRDDPLYAQMSSAPKVALNGDFREVINRSIETSWRETSKPYGEIAHKRYLEYLANLPKGPTDAEIIAVLQKKADTDLWDNIKYGRTELNLKQRREQRLQEQDSQLAQFVNENKVDIHRKERLRKAAIEQGRYDLLRVLPTRNQHEDSIRGWSHGTNYPYNFESNGYPQIHEEKELRGSASLGVVEDKRFGYGGPRNKTLRAKHQQQINDKYMGERTVERDFWHYMSNIRLNVAIDSIEKEKARERRMKQRRRGVGNVFAERGDTRDQVSVQASLLAQVALLQDREKRMGDRNEQHWQPSSLHWESNHTLHSNGYLRSIIDFINLNFWRQSQYRAKVHPFEGSGKSENSIINFSWLLKLLDKIISSGEPQTDVFASERTAKCEALSVAEENLKNFITNITKSRRCLQEDEKRLRPNAAKMLRGLVSKQRLKEYAMAKRRLEALEANAEQVLALKQKAVDDATAALETLPRDDSATVPKEDSIIDTSSTLPISSYDAMRSQENTEKLRQIVQQRQDEKKRQQSIAKLENKLFCRSEEQQRDVDGSRPTADDLASSGRYKDVIDMIYHRFYPIDVTVPNSDGLTATYAVLRLLLQDASPSTAGGDKDELFGDLLAGALQRMRNRVVAGVYSFLGVDYQQRRRLNQRQQSMDVVLQLLISNGGRIEDKYGDYDTDKLSVLHLAAAAGGLTMMQWLLDAGVDVNIRTEFGKTPLMFSVESGSVPAMVLLLRSGAMREINVVDRDGNTALHIAARKASVEFAQLLLACDASKRLRNKDGLTAEDMASRLGRTAMAVTLTSFLPPEGEFRHRIAFMMQQFAADCDSLDDDDMILPEDDNGEQNAQYNGAEELEEEKVQEVITDQEAETFNPVEEDEE